MEELNKSINELSAKGRIFAEELKIKGHADLKCIARQTACYLKALLAVKETGPLERRLADERYAVLSQGRSASSALKKTKPFRAVSGTPLVLLFAREYLRSCSWRAQCGSLESFLAGFQNIHPLEHRELWLLGDIFACLITVRLGQLAKSGGSVSEAEDCLASLRALSRAKLRSTLRAHDLLDRALRSDPAGIYEKMTRQSRDEYCVLLSKLAKKQRIPELEAAETALALAAKGEGRGRHVGYYLINMPLGKRRKNYSPLVKTVITALTLSLTVLVSFAAKSALSAPFAVLPIWFLCKKWVQSIVKRTVKPDPTPTLDYTKEVPAEGKTVCALSCLLTDGETAASLAQKLEELYLSNPECSKNLVWALLADLPDGEEREEERRILSRAACEIERLNELYSGGFMLFTRPKMFSRREGKYMAPERKRGAIEELVGFLTASASAVRVRAGEPSRLEGAKYILALDADTLPMPGSISLLIGTLAHPLNKATVERGRVTIGWAAAVPRQEVLLSDSEKTPFARSLAGRGGWDSYAPADERRLICRRSGFGGKGLIDISAYKQCLWGRIPRGRVLSHDLLEGEYLRTLYVPGAMFADGFPTRLIPWSARLDRWTRGDWQCLYWVMPRVRTPGGLRNNPLCMDSRLCILENAARSLVLPSALTLTLLAAFGAVPPVFLLASLITAYDSVKDCVLSLAKYEKAGERALKLAKEQLAAAFLKLSIFAHESFVCLTAAVTAVVRMAFTRRHMLQWVTSAQAERGKNDFSSYLKKLWPALITGAAVLAAADNAFAAALGAVWIISPLTALLYSRERENKTEFSEGEKDWLLSQAKSMASYFEENMTPEHNFLPPDNVQTRPCKGAAARTSPTNIGLALLSAVSANILGLWDEEKTLTLCENCLETVMKLEKWNGQLYNWYSTRTLTPLAPGDISSVDSGNLCACLAAVCEAFRNMKHPMAENPALMAEKLISDMDFQPLYDSERRLLRISVRPGENFESSCYDLLASEARLTYFVTVALGKADKRIWYSLSRACMRAGNRRPLASWSGTAFEYLMPRILLSEPRGSLLDSSAKAALRCQRKMSPWGISESCWYSFDETLDYRYKAHGVQSLALGRCRGDERVISPYSSFLALDVEPRAALENLLLLESMGLGGKYGLCEALDLTPGRGPGGRGAVVDCHMAHHLGMSIASVCNCLTDGALKKLFLANSRIRAWQSLLREKTPLVSALAARGLAFETARSFKGSRQPIEDEGPGLAMQDCCLLSNGLLSAVFDRCGRQSIRCGGAEVTLEGILWSVSLNGKEYSLAPYSDGDAERSSVFSSDCAVFRSGFDGLECTLETSVVLSQPGLVQRLRIKNTTGDNKTAELKIAFTPVLEGAGAYFSHPAFSKLFLEAKEHSGGVVVKRRKRSGSQSACLFAALSRPGAKAVLHREGRNADRLSDECSVSFSLAVPVYANSSQELKFALCMGDDVSACEAGAKYCLEKGISDRSDREREFSSLEGTALFDAGCALELLKRLSWPCHKGALGSREELYLHGISGDLPIVSSDAKTADAEKLLLANRYLTFAGRPFDLVLFVPKEGYAKPEYHSLMGKMRWTDCSSRLSKRGGVHLVDNERALLISSLSEAGWPLDPIEPCIPQKRGTRNLKDGITEYSQAGAKAVLRLKNRLSEAVWSVPLANESFGTIAADCGFMGSWYKNARENRLTPWVNDPLALEGSEKLELHLPEGSVSAFAACDGWDTSVTFEPGLVRWEKSRDGQKIITEAYVPPHVSARVMTVKTEGLSGIRGEYRTRLIMGSAMNKGEHTLYTPTVGGFEARDLYNGDFRGQRALILGGPATVDQCGVKMTFDAGEGARIVLGCAETPLQERAIRELAEKGCDAGTAAPGPVSISTPEKAIDNYVNHWALYQTKVCRLWARCSVYQCGGAYGFRDQLQDVCALIWSDSHLAREHILRACSKQFEQGDCAHWWHELSGVSKGVRTRCSDDLLWLCYAAALYAKQTGDKSIFEEKVPFLTWPPLEKGEKDRYGILVQSERSGTVYEHCLKAIDCFIARGEGEHSLPLMLSGDWNDGMDKVGEAGRGESVWLAWFAVTVLRLFAPFCPPGEEERLLAHALKLENAARSAWDGEWYLRGYFDSGAPLGSKQCSECAIDSIAQGFAPLAGVNDENTQRALRNALKLLMRPEAHAVALFTPPFEGRGEDAGYIGAYPPGIRENGGQYTHGAIWLAMGCLRAGLREEGLEILKTIAPGGRYDETYAAEPWVIAADVSLKKGIEGKAGWSWYTGSSGWFYRAVLEELIGLKLENGIVTWDAKCLPPGWSGENVSVTVKGKPLRPGESIRLI